MGTKKEQLKTYIYKEIKDKFTYIAKENKRSASAELELIIEKHINNYEYKNGKLIINKNGNVEISKPKEIKENYTNSKTS